MNVAKTASQVRILAGLTIAGCNLCGNHTILHFMASPKRMHATVCCPPDVFTAYGYHQRMASCHQHQVQQSNVTNTYINQCSSQVTENDPSTSTKCARPWEVTQCRKTVGKSGGGENIYGLKPNGMQ